MHESIIHTFFSPSVSFHFHSFSLGQDIDASLLTPVVDGNRLSFLLVFTYTDRKTRDLNVDEIPITWEFNDAEGDGLRLIEGYIEDEHPWHSYHAKSVHPPRIYIYIFSPLGFFSIHGAREKG